MLTITGSRVILWLVDDAGSNRIQFDVLYAGQQVATLQELTRTLVADGSGNLLTGSPFTFLGKGKLLLWSTTGSFDALQWSVVLLDPYNSMQVVVGQSDPGEIEGAWYVQPPAAGVGLQ